MSHTHLGCAELHLLSGKMDTAIPHSAADSLNQLLHENRSGHPVKESEMADVVRVDHIVVARNTQFDSRFHLHEAAEVTAIRVANLSAKKGAERHFMCCHFLSPEAPGMREMK